MSDIQGWEYDNHPMRGTVTDACNLLKNKLIKYKTECEGFFSETRSYHKAMFQMVTPVGKENYAGNYRGHTASYLSNYQVEIASSLGCPPSQVEKTMMSFHEELKKNFTQLEEKVLHNSDYKQEVKLKILAEFISFFMVYFLAIHPYANGNGHISRAIVLISFIGFNPLLAENWCLDKRPEQPFDMLISQYRAGDKLPLIAYFLEMTLLKS